METNEAAGNDVVHEVDALRRRVSTQRRRPSAAVMPVSNPGILNRDAGIYDGRDEGSPGIVPGLAGLGNSGRLVGRRSGGAVDEGGAEELSQLSKIGFRRNRRFFFRPDHPRQERDVAKINVDLDLVDRLARPANYFLSLCECPPRLLREAFILVLSTIQPRGRDLETLFVGAKLLRTF